MRSIELILFLAIIGSFIILEMRMDKLESRLSKQESNISKLASGLMQLHQEDLYVRSIAK